MPRKSSQAKKKLASSSTEKGPFISVLSASVPPGNPEPGDGHHVTLVFARVAAGTVAVKTGITR